MTDEEEKKKKKKKQMDWLEAFIFSLLEKCASVAIEMAFNNLFGEPQPLKGYSPLEEEIISSLEGIAEEELDDLFSCFTEDSF